MLPQDSILDLINNELNQIERHHSFDKCVRLICHIH